MKNKSLLILVTSFLVLTQIVVAEKKQEPKIYKCTSATGNIFYNDKPCPVDNKEIRMKAIKDPLSSGSAHTKKNKFAPVPSLVIKKKKTKEVKKVESDKRKEYKAIVELEGGEKELQDQLEREDRARTYSGDDERRERINDRYNNPPAGSRKPIGTGDNQLVEEYVEKMLEKNRGK